MNPTQTPRLIEDDELRTMSIVDRNHYLDTWALYQETLEIRAEDRAGVWK